MACRPPLRLGLPTRRPTGPRPGGGLGLGVGLALQLPPAVRRSSASAEPSPRPAERRSDPLRILFCGSDAFSCASLAALHAEHLANPGLVASIDVVARPPKPAGRGRRALAEPPILPLARRLGLRVHLRDTFTGWTPPAPAPAPAPSSAPSYPSPPASPLRPSSPPADSPPLPAATGEGAAGAAGEPVNLIVAVSFGLFVPPRLLRAARYGGLNVHPSLLPDLRGPAPLHHALLLGLPRTGVTLQTLDPASFDRGVILAQTPPPGIPIPAGEGAGGGPGGGCTVERLRDELAARGAEMLVGALRGGLHVPPLAPAGWWRPPPGEPLRHAPKVGQDDMELDWAGRRGRPPAARELARRAAVLGRLWTRVAAPGGSGKALRIIFEGVEACACPEALKAAAAGAGGSAESRRGDGGGGGGGGVDYHVLMDPAETQPPRSLCFVQDVPGSSDRQGAERQTKVFRVPYIEQDGAIVIPVGDGVPSATGDNAPFDAVSIKKATIEGSSKRDAARALAPFAREAGGVSYEDLL